MLCCCQRLCNLRLLAAINDLQAMPYVSLATKQPSLHWACRSCNTLGIHIAGLGTVVYPGAIRFIDSCGADISRSLRREWCRAFRRLPAVLAMQNRPIFKRSGDFCRRAGLVAEAAFRKSVAAGKRAVYAGGFHGLGMYG